DYQIVEFVRVGATADPGNALAAVYRAAVGVLFDECLVARLLHQLADLVDRLVPGDVFPVIGAGPPDLRLQQAPLVQNVLFERCALRAEGAAVDGMVGVAFNMDYLRRNVLGLVANGVNDHSAAYRTVGARRTGLARARDLERSKLRVSWGQVETEYGGSRASQ